MNAMMAAAIGVCVGGLLVTAVYEHDMAQPKKLAGYVRLVDLPTDPMPMQVDERGFLLASCR